MDTRNGTPRYRVPALERGLRLLELFNGERTEISFSEAARELQLPRASTYRIVKTLEFMGYLRLLHGATYALGPAAIQFGLPAEGDRTATSAPSQPQPAHARMLQIGA